jgi:hypothetical protein
MSDFTQAAADAARSIQEDVGNTYYDFIAGTTGGFEPVSFTADYVNIGSEMETVQSYQSALVEHGVSVGLETEADHWRQQEMQPEPEIEAPEITAPDIDAAEPG